MGVLLTKEKKAHSVGSTSTYAYKFKLEVIENSTNVVGNTSNVTINLYGAMYSGWGFSGFKTPKATIKVDNAKKAEKTVSKITSTSYVLLATTTYDVEHESDGTKKINVVGEFNPNATDYSYLPRKTTISGDVTLSTIAQRTEITISDTYIESKPTILLNKKNDSFTTTLQYKFDGQTEWTIIATKVTDKTYYNGWTIPSSAYALIPNASKILCKVQAITYSGNEQVGEAFETTFTAVASEEKCKPGLDNLSIANSVDYSSLTGSSSKFIKYISKPKITWNATAKNSATIRNQTINGNSCTSPYTAPSWLNSYVIGITDSRGFINTHTYNSNNMEIVDYVPLTLVANVKRHTPTDGKVVVSIGGNWFNGNFGVADNALIAYYKYRKKGTDTWATSDNLTLTKTNNKYSCETTLENFVYTDAFEFIFYVSDKVSSINSGTIQVPSGKTVADWGKDDFRINVPLSVEGYDMASEFSSKNKFSTYLTQMNTDYRTTASFVKVKPNTTYIFSSKDNNVNFLGNLIFCNSNQVQTSQIFTFTAPFTTPSDCEWIKLVFANKNAPLDAKIQLEEGTEKTSFAPYIDENVANTMANANLFRNMLNIPDGTYTHNGVTYIVKDGIFTYSSGTATSDVNIGINIAPFTLKAGTYTMSNNSGRHPYILLYSGNTKVVESEYADNGVKTFTIENETTIDNIHLYFGLNTPPASVKPQVEEGTRKSNFTSWAGYIVESGLNDNGSYIKFSDGTMICRNKKTFNRAANVAYGALFKTEGIDFPNFPVAFKDVPDISFFCIGVNTALLANWNASTKEKIGPLIGIRPVSTNAQDYIISYIAIGRWK